MGFIFMSLLDTDTSRLKFEDVYYCYRDMMYRIAFGILKDDQLAKEALSTAFEALARNIEKLDTGAPKRLKSYVYKVIKNASYDISDRQRLHAGIISLDQAYSVSAHDDVHSAVESDEEYGRIISIIKSLPEKYRDVLSLYYVDAFDTRTIADLLSRPATTVRSQLRRGTKLLREKLKEEMLYD